MKRLFTLAIVSLIASLTFAQAPAQKKAAAQAHKLEKVISPVQLQKAMEAKNVQQLKAAAAQETAGSVLRQAKRTTTGAALKELRSNQTVNANVRPVNFNAAKTTKANVAPRKNESTGPAVATKDAQGIITNVTGGESRVYTRAQAFYAYVSSGQIKYAYQSGNVSVIVDGNDFYIKDIICNIGVGTWVKGTLNADGTKLVVPAGQMIYWNTQGYGMTVNMGTTPGTWAKSNDDITYTVDGNTLTLDGAHASVSGGYINFQDGVLGTFWSDDNSFAGYGEWSTVLTYDPGYVPPTTELVQLPAGAQVEQWHMNANDIKQTGSQAIKNQAVNVAFVGNDVYVQGIFKSMFPNAWIKGTIDGTKATFANIQYIGKDSYGDDTWAQGYSAEKGLCDFTATYDAEAKTFTGVEELLANCDVTRAYYDFRYSGISIFGKEPVKPEEPVITELTAELPYANSFDTEAEQAEAAIYDANEDGKTFTFASDSKTKSTTARYTYSTKDQADDYVVFPGLTLNAGTSYKVSVDARSYNDKYPERFEIVAGTEAKASKLNIPILAATDVASGEYVTFAADFTPEADGVYYIAIHGISDPDNFYLYTDNFAVKENNMSVPMAPQNLVITPDPAAALSATIEFDAPSTTLAGDAITEGLTVTVTRDGDVIAENVAATAGQHITITDDKMAKPGTFVYSVTATVNELTSDATKASAYVGEDLPLDVENLEAEDKNGKVALSWDAVGEIGTKGGIVIPENVVYNVYPVEIIEFWGMQFPEIDFENPYVTDLKETATEVDFNTNEGDHGYTYFGVTAENAAGETNGAMCSLLTGAPYELPLVEELAGGKLTYWWGVDYDDNVYNADGGLGITEDGMFQFNAPVAGWIELLSGKVSLEGATSPALLFDYTGQGKFTVTAYGPNKEIVKEITPEADVQTANIDLAELIGEPWVRFTIHADFEAAGQAFVGSILVMNQVEKDLEIALSVPTKINLGNKATIKATVKNKGTEDAAAYTVKFYADNKEMLSITEVPTLEFFETAEFSFELETSIFDEAGESIVKAEVVYSGDADPDNNIDEAVVSLIAPTATPVESVSAEDSAEGVLVSWTIAENSNQEVTEDFESYQIGITADGGTMGPWSAIDGDKGYTYGWESEKINWEYTGEKYAFAIMNFPNVFGAATDIEATSGEQALMFMSVTNDQELGFPADDWFISPELPGIAQTISFMARPMTAQYGPETLEVMASTDGQNWTKVTSFDVIAEEFKEFTVDLAEGTKYFALHYTSNDVFALFIDDLKYTVSGGTPTGFNIYVDEVLYTTADAEATSCVVSGLDAGKHKFSVTALYGTTESAPVSADITTAINAILGNGAATEAYTISGMRTSTKNMKHGIYVIDGKKIVK